MAFTAPLSAPLQFASDLISSVLYPKNKLVYGADGTATDVTATTGLPVAEGGAPADKWFLITPGSSALGVIPKAIRCNGGGVLLLQGSDGNVEDFTVVAGELLPCRARYVLASATVHGSALTTTATGIKGMA